MKHTGNILLASRWKRGYSKNFSIEIHGSSQRAHSGIHGSPVVVPPVVPWPQQVLPPPVVGQLIQDPAALQHVEGADLTEVEAVVERGAVLCDLHHLASVVLSLVDPDSVGAGLWIQQSADEEKALARKSHFPTGNGHFLIYLYQRCPNKRKRQPAPGPLYIVGSTVQCKADEGAIHID